VAGDHTLNEFLARTNTIGFIVLKDGKIVYERYFMSADQNSRLLSFSVAKSFTSTLVGMAIADEKIESVNQPVTSYLPELKGSGYEAASIQDLLEMSPVRSSAITSMTPSPTPLLCGTMRWRGMGK
jgi:Beta-lactamase